MKKAIIIILIYSALVLCCSCSSRKAETQINKEKINLQVDSTAALLVETSQKLEQQQRQFSEKKVQQILQNLKVNPVDDKRPFTATVAVNEDGSLTISGDNASVDQTSSQTQDTQKDSLISETISESDSSVNEVTTVQTDLQQEIKDKNKNSNRSGISTGLIIGLVLIAIVVIILVILRKRLQKLPFL